MAAAGAKYRTYETRLCVHTAVAKAEATERYNERSFQTFLSARSVHTTGLVSKRSNARVAGVSNHFGLVAIYVFAFCSLYLFLRGKLKLELKFCPLN